MLMGRLRGHECKTKPHGHELKCPPSKATIVVCIALEDTERRRLVGVNVNADGNGGYHLVGWLRGVKCGTQNLLMTKMTDWASGRFMNEIHVELLQL